MKTYTFIEEGRVGQIGVAESIPAGAVEVGPNIRTGDTYDGTKFYRDGVELIPPPRIWNSLEFLSKFTSEERAAVRGAAPDLAEILLAAHEVNSEDQLTQYAFAQLVAAGIFTQERVNQVLEIA